MLRRLENMSGFLSFRDASIRTKVILAFLGVLFLILPQIVLTVSYMVELFEDGDSVGRSSSASLTLGKIHMKLEQGFLAPYPVTQEALGEHKKTVVSASENIEEAEEGFLALQVEDERFASYASTLSHIRRELDGYLAELELQVEANLQVVPPVTRREVTSRIHQDLDDLTRAWDDPLLDSQVEEPQTADERLSILRKIAFRAIKDVVATPAKYRAVFCTQPACLYQSDMYGRSQS